MLPPDVGVLACCPITILAKLELLPAWLECIFERLSADPLLLVLEYGLLMARLRLNPLREVEDDIRCRLWRKRCLPLSFGACSIGSISTCEGIIESIVSSGSKVSIVGGVISVYKRTDAGANDDRNIQRYCTNKWCIPRCGESGNHTQKKPSDQADITDSVDEMRYEVKKCNLRLSSRI